MGGTPLQITMRLLVEGELKPAGGIIGTGFDELRWPRPVRPGDELVPRAQDWKFGGPNLAWTTG